MKAHESKKSKSKKTILFYVIFIFIIVLGPLLLLEGAARVFWSAYTKNWSFLTYNLEYKPLNVFGLHLEKHNSGKRQYYKEVPNNKYEAGGVDIHINSRGFRTPEFALKKDKFRIACFGGSSTFGSGNRQDETWPAYLQKRLEAQYPGKVEVINSGFGSFNSEMIKRLLRYEFLEYQPDLIMLYSGYNDHTGGKAKIFTNSPETYIALLNLNRYFERKLALYYVMKQVYAKFWGTDFIRIGQDTAQGYKENVKEIIAMSKERGIEVILVKQPLYLKSLAPSSAGSGAKFNQYYQEARFNPQTLEKIKSDLKARKDQAYFGRTYYFQYLIFEALDEIAASSDVKVVGFVNSFIEAQESEGDLFIDVVHLTDRGNALLVDNILKNVDFAQFLAKSSDK